MGMATGDFEAQTKNSGGWARHTFLDAPGYPPMPQAMQKDCYVQFLSGKDTRDVAIAIGVHESLVYNAITKERAA
jgi:hypothetical protein